MYSLLIIILKQETAHENLSQKSVSEVILNCLLIRGNFQPHYSGHFSQTDPTVTAKLRSWVQLVFRVSQMTLVCEFHGIKLTERSSSFTAFTALYYSCVCKWVYLFDISHIHVSVNA